MKALATETDTSEVRTHGPSWELIESWKIRFNRIHRQKSLGTIGVANYAVIVNTESRKKGLKVT